MKTYFKKNIHYFTKIKLKKNHNLVNKLANIIIEIVLSVLWRLVNAGQLQL